MSKSRFNLWFVFWPVQLLALYGIIFTSPNWLLFFIGWVVLCGLGSAVILHRVVSHRSIKLKKYLEKPLLFLSCLCVQGSPLWWAAVHRGMHHTHADKQGDPHSPRDGFWHSYIGWIHNKKLGKINPKVIKDIRNNQFHLWLNRYYTHIVWSTFIILSAIDFNMMLWLWAIPAAWSYHQEAIVNSVCHLGTIGYKNKKSNDNAMNIPFLGLLTWGQALHNNHHVNTRTYSFAREKNEFDPSVIFLPFIADLDTARK